jgi:DNA-binding protein
MEKEFNVNDLIEQLKDSGAAVKKTSSKEEFKLNREDLENFVLGSTGKLVTQGLDIIENVKDYVMNNPESREVESLSEALKAVASALNVIKDIHVTHLKKDNLKEIKTMEIESRKILKTEENKNKLMLSRDEMFKKILEDAKVIEAEAVTVSQFPKLSS